jgi:hypothetical protein
MHLQHTKPTFAWLALAFALLFSAFPAAAQDSVPTNQPALLAPSDPSLPELPLFPLIGSYVAAQNPVRSARLFGFVPNYDTVEPGAHPQALAIGDKFKLSVQLSFDPAEFLIPASVAALTPRDYSPSANGEFADYGGRYAVAFANQAMGTVMTRAVFPSLLHQDPRYYQRARGGFFSRFAHAGSRIFLTRSDSGMAQFNYSEFLGNAAASAISNLYVPASSRTLAASLATWETAFAVDAISYEAKEFWPSLRRKLSRKQ